MSLGRGKRHLNDQSESEYSDNFEDESDSGSASSCNDKISNNKKRFRRSNSSELNTQFQNAIYSKMAVPRAKTTNMSNQLGQHYEATLTGKRNRCYSKNALNARENRLKKKLYVDNLEKTVDKFRVKNKQLTVLLENQTNILSDMKREVQYYKSVIANSKDISRLLQCLNQNTGMPVTTSINKNISAGLTHPWAENTNTCLNGIESDQFIDNSELNLSLDAFLPESTLNFEDPKLPDDIFQQFAEEYNSTPDFKPSLIDEHNYNAKSPDSSEVEEVGVCLHISNHKMSLEFCPMCSEKATSNWHHS